jgi:two-component system, NtrC family, sensor histidine kinase HydH
MTAITKDNIEEVQMRMLHQRLERFSRLRLVLLPILGVFLALTLVGDDAIWRWVIVGFLVLSMPLRLVVERGRPRQSWRHESHRHVSSIALLPMAALLLATGGIDSPLLPVTLVICFFIGALTSGRTVRVAALTLSSVVIGFALLAGFGVIPNLMPAIYGGGSHLPQPTTLLVAKAVTFVALLAWTVMSSNMVRGTFRGMVNEAVEARDEVLRGNEAHAQELTLLSGELAHELKNPLANIKGLAVLVSRDVQGRGAERLQVMQHEIARMEEVLQEFLTFSRPLSPLSQDSVDLRRLCESVLSLHEGMAYARNVQITLDGDASVTVLCDPRKVKQILINLLQNALDAAPAHTVVTIKLLNQAGDRACVEMRDDGPGLSDEVKAHLFHAGTTSKERGSGLGLALARGLARQHGGDLRLENRPEGGCVATLILPTMEPKPEQKPEQEATRPTAAKETP